MQRNIGRDGAGLQLRHVEQVGDETVESFGFVDDRAEKIGLLGGIEFLVEVAQRPRRPEHRSKRGLQIMGDRREESGSQTLGFGDALDAIHILDQPDPLNCERALIPQRVEQPALIGAEQRSRLVAVDTHDADGAAPGMHRQKQALGAGQRIGAAAGCAIVLPGPSRGGKVGAVENVFRRVAGLHRNGTLFGQQQNHPYLEHQRGLIGGRPQHVVERRSAGKFAAEGIERLGRARPIHCRHRLSPAARRHVRDQKRDEREKAEGSEIGRIGEREPEIRRDKNGVVAYRRRDAGEQRRP